MSVARQPRWSFVEPRADQIAEFLEGQADVPFAYPDVGLSRDPDASPPGFTLDHNRVQVGHGERDFAAACAGLRRWQMFPGQWTKIGPSVAPIQAGTVVAMQAHALGLWWMNACRIVYVMNEIAPLRRFGFAYGTLPAHVEAGEERFSVEFLGDGSVWYDIRAFSRPRYWPVRLAKPLARRLQRRFVRDSKRAMLEVVREARS
jgi:uncharacterized protein (UPF0548 family)